MIDPSFPRNNAPSPHDDMQPLQMQEVPRSGGAKAPIVAGVVAVALIVIFALSSGGGDTTDTTMPPPAIESTAPPAVAVPDTAGTPPAAPAQQ